MPHASVRSGFHSVKLTARASALSSLVVRQPVCWCKSRTFKVCGTEIQYNRKHETGVGWIRR